MLGDAPIDTDIHEAASFSANQIYTVPVTDPIYRKGIDPDFSEALIVRSGATIEDVCDQIHRTLKDTFKYALVWGASARHVPQKVGLSHVVSDEDVVSVVAK